MLSLLSTDVNVAATLTSYFGCANWPTAAGALPTSPRSELYMHVFVDK